MKEILNCTNHSLTDEQKSHLLDLGYNKVSSLKEQDPELFNILANLKGNENLKLLALNLLDKGRDYTLLFPIGSPLFGVCLGFYLRDTVGIKILFSHSLRVSVEKQINDKVIKQNTFQHVGFYVVDNQLDVNYMPFFRG